MSIAMTGSAARPTILIVEDEAPLMTLMRYNLEKQGFAVEEATDGQEALLRVAEARPDLILLDWMLPAMSGLEVCRQLRRRPNTRDLPIIMVTARTEDQDAVRALDTGADDYIAKPFAMESLLARIRALLRRSGGVPEKGTLRYNDLAMDQDAHRVTRNGRALHLGGLQIVRDFAIGAVVDDGGKACGLDRGQIGGVDLGRDGIGRGQGADVHVSPLGWRPRRCGPGLRVRPAYLRPWRIERSPRPGRRS